jgi:hypothetical protein
VNFATIATVVLIGAHATGCAVDTCPSCDPPEREGQVENPELIELSGIAASFRHEDVIYAHNDSGDTARFFALSSTGTHLAIFDLEDGADNDDWEDIARAPCASGECLYIADIGDNDLDRTSYTIYLIDEPTTIATGTLPYNRMRFTYPEDHVNAEVLLVHPVTGEVTLVSKVEDGPASVYELGTLSADSDKKAEKVGEIDPPDGRAKFTGGSIHPDGTGILLRTNTRLFHYPMQPEQTAAEALAGEPCQLELAEETQGEAVTWLRGGAGIMTIGELPVDAPINVARCGG